MQGLPASAGTAFPAGKGRRKMFDGKSVVSVLIGALFLGTGATAQAPFAAGPARLK